MSAITAWAKARRKAAGGRTAPLAAALCLFVLAQLCAPFVSYAAFDRQDAGARAGGMGGGFVAVGGDVNSVFHNPAGLAYLNRSEISTSYGRLFMGLDDGSTLSTSLLTYGQPVKKLGSFGAGWLETGLDALYKERTLALAYGRRLGGKLAVGAVVKQLQVAVSAPERNYDNSGQAIGLADSVFSGNKPARGASLDAGLMYEPFPMHAFGLSLSNVNQPDVSLAGGGANRIPLLARLGYSHRGSAFLFTSEVRTQEYLTARRDWQGVVAGESRLRAGKALGFALRGSIAYGSRSYSQATAGLGCRAGPMDLDYAFMMPLSGISFGGTAGTHKFSLTVRFGKATGGAWEPEAEPVLDAAEVAALRAELKEARERAAATEALVREMQAGIKALEEEKARELERQSQAAAPDAGVVEPLEDEIRRLKAELEKAKEEGGKIERKKAIIENRLEGKEPVKKEVPGPVSGRTYVVRSGDTLRNIAERALGDASRWIEIYRANEGRVGRGGDVEPGQVIRIP